MQEWISGGSVATRISHIQGTTLGGLNGSYRLQPGQSLFSDGEIDLLDGGNGTNWLI